MPRADRYTRRFESLLFAVCTMSAGLAVCAEPALKQTSADTLVTAITSGQPDLYVRYRFEYVDDGVPALKNAYANTVRTALGYNTGLFHNFGLYLQMEDVRVLGDALFDDGGTNGVKNRAVVVDPEGTELKQANIRFEGLPGTVLRAGRQEIVYRQAPLHRYVGNVLWRQHWQMYDAFRFTNKSLANTTLEYAYVWNVNRIFGENNPLPDRADFKTDGHFITADYTGFAVGKFEPYIYLLRDVGNSNAIWKLRRLYR